MSKKNSETVTISKAEYESFKSLKEHCAQLGVPFALNNAWAEGGEGAKELAQLVIKNAVGI